MIAVTQIPWHEVVRFIPTVVIAARTLWTKGGSESEQLPLDPEAEIRDMLGSCIDRLHALEASGVVQVEVIKEIAEKMEGLCDGLTEVSRRSSFALRVAGGSLAISCLLGMLVVATR